MPSAFTKNEAERGGKNNAAKLWHRKNKKGGRVQGRELGQDRISVKINCMNLVFAGRLDVHGKEWVSSCNLKSLFLAWKRKAKGRRTGCLAQASRGQQPTEGTEVSVPLSSWEAWPDLSWSLFKKKKKCLSRLRAWRLLKGFYWKGLFYKVTRDNYCCQEH